MLTDTVTDLVEGYVQGLERDLKEKKDIVDSVERYMERGRVVKETCFSWPCAWQEALALSQAPDVAVVVACMEAAWNVRCAHVEHVHEGADVCKRKDDVSPALAALLGGHS